MQEKSGTGDGNSESGDGEQINQSQNQQEAGDGADEIDFLNPADIRVETRHDAIDVQRKLNGESGQNDGDQEKRVARGGAVFSEHRVQNRRDDDGGGTGKFSPDGQAGVDQFAETMSILPNAATDGDQTNADADIGEQHECGLHRVGDGIKGVLLLGQPSDEQNSTRESDDLNDRLHEHVIADAAGVIERSP